MKQPKKLTRVQKEFLEKQGIEHYGWMLIHESALDLQIINKLTNEIRVLKK